MQNLQKQIAKISQNIKHFQISNPKISESNVAWHLEHSLLVINAIIGALKKSEPTKYKYKFNVIKYLILLFKRMPRGKAKSPKHVVPHEIINEESLKIHIEKTLQNCHYLSILPSNSYFSHPIFGDMKLKTAIQFLEIHTKHHLLIINDIIKK